MHALQIWHYVCDEVVKMHKMIQIHPFHHMHELEQQKSLIQQRRRLDKS
jgi:hypothetical protein